jgi:hypothetical protein
MKDIIFITKKRKLGVYFMLLFSVFFISSLKAQSDYVITTAETWHSNQTFSTNVVVDAGGTLTIDAGVVIGINYADVNNDNLGDLKLEVKNGGKLIINGTPSNPVIFQGSGVNPPVAAGDNNWWQGIIMTSTTGSNLQGVTVKNASNGLAISGSLSVTGLSISNSINGVTVSNSGTGTVELNAITLSNITGKGIVVNAGKTIIRNSTLSSISGNGIEVNTPNVTIDWTTITGTKTGIFNSSTATNTVITNSSITGNNKSGIFNTLGTVSVTNSKIDSNAYHGIVNSGGILTINKSDISNNTSRGIIAAGNGTTTVQNVTDTANGNVGFDIITYKQTADSLAPSVTGTADTVMPTVSFLNSNIFSNSKTSTPANIQVRSAATKVSPIADFTTNWWGQTSGILNLVSVTTPNSVNYINWRIAGLYTIGASSDLNPSKSISLTYPVAGQSVIQNQDLTVKWTSAGNIPYVILVNRVGAAESYRSVVANTGSYTFQPTVANNATILDLKDYAADSTTVIASANTYKVIASAITINKPLTGDTVTSNQPYIVRWVAPSTVTKVSIAYAKGGVFTTSDSTLLASAVDATTGSYSVTIPSSPTGAVGKFKIVNFTSGSAADSAVVTGVNTVPTPPWTFTRTGSSMNIAIDTIQFLPDKSAANGENADVYIGAFYNDSNNKLKNCGYVRGIVTVTGVNQYRALTVWGDDPTTSTKEGPADGDPVYLKVWKQSWGTSDSTIRIRPNGSLASDTSTFFTYTKNATAVFDSVFFRTGSVSVSSNADSVVFVLSGLTAAGSAGKWFLVSSYVVPNTPTIVSVTDSLRGASADSTLVLAKDGNGGAYWPALNINGIDPPAGNGWVATQAYYLKLQGGVGNDDTLKIYGNKIEPQTTPITLSAGWNWVAYLRDSSLSIANALSSISKYLVIVKDDAGKVYWPAYSINEIGDMVPGKGYQIKLSSGDVLTYPANTSASKSVATATSSKETVHYIVKTNSDNSSTIGILETAIKGKVSANDEIGVFNSEGKLVGSSVYTSGNAAVVVWGRESASKSGFGMKEGEAYTIKVWNATSGSETELSGVSYLQGAGSYSANGISLVSKVQGLANVIPTEFSISQNYPNPFNPSTTINFALPQDSKVKITVFNVIGQLVSEVVNAEMKAGYHQVNFNAAKLASGVYFYQINAGKFNVTKKMNLLK